MAPTSALLPHLPPGRELELPGRGVTFVREQAGPPGAPTVLLLHGWTVTADLNWFPSYRPLARHYNVVALDHRGHGRGIRPPGGRVRLSDCADDAAALLDALGVERAIAVGYSMGGPVAQLLWRRHPERVAGLVLCATSGDFAGGPLAEISRRGFHGLGQLAARTPGLPQLLFERVMGGRVEGGPGAAWARSELVLADPTGLVTALASLSRFSSNAWIGEVDVPAAVVVTALDQTVPPSRQGRLAEMIPGATEHVVQGGHDVCGTDPGRFLPVLLDACASVESRLER